MYLQRILCYGYVAVKVVQQPWKLMMQLGIYVLGTLKEHNQNEVSKRQLAKDNLHSTCKSKAAENICDKSRKIMPSALSAIDTTEESDQHDLPTIQRSMYEERRKCIPKVPQSQEEALIQIRNNFTYVENNIIFVTYNTN